MATNLMGTLPSIPFDSMLLSSGSICLYPVSLNRTVKFTAKLVRFLKQLSNKLFESTLDWLTTSRFYYMASSVSGQDELNPVACLATRASKMELSCPLRTTRSVP